MDSLEIFKKIDQNLNAIDEFLNTDLQAVQNKNEKTPSKPKSFSVVSRDSNEKPSSARCLFPSSDSTPTTSAAINTPASNSNSSKKPSYKLTEIYKRLYKCEALDAHNAESDAMHLLKCAVATRKDFVQIADSMAIKLIDAQFK